MDRSELELRYETMLEEYPDTKIIFSEGAAEQFAELMSGKSCFRRDIHRQFQRSRRKSDAESSESHGLHES